MSYSKDSNQGNVRNFEDEEYYLDYLEHERHMFAWCLERYKGMPSEMAKQQAESFYPYEPSAKAFRGLIFHDEAWHWAMLKIVGDFYWKLRPDLKQASADYRTESKNFSKT